LSYHDDDLAFATTLAEEAGLILLDRYERLERIDYKGTRDVVTEADFLAEALIVDAIRRRYPTDGIIAEESGDHRLKGRDSPPANTGRVWVVDPLDGTVNYANGIPVFCVSIALAVDGRATVGVIVDPMRRESFSATVTGPARLNGREITCADATSRDELLVATSFDLRIPSRRFRDQGQTIRTRSLGSAALELTYVANGRLDAFIQRRGLSNWDVAAAGLIAERAGATVTSTDGSAWFDLERRPGSISIIGASPAAYRTVMDRLPGDRSKPRIIAR
jgi:myo-inositol-1(or 4)-monophosphatase